MRLGNVTVGVAADYGQLEQDFRDGKERFAKHGQDLAQAVGDGFTAAKSKAKQAGQDMAQALGEGLAKARDYLTDMERETEEFLSRNKGKIALAAAATAGYWAYSNPDEARRYYSQMSEAASQAAGRISSGFEAAYGSLTRQGQDMAANFKAAMGDMGRSVAQAAGDISGGFGQAGQEAAKYFVQEFLRGASDVFLKLGQQAVTTAADLGAMSGVTGQSVEELSVLKRYADDTGQSLESMAARFRALTEATTGQSDAARLAREQLAAVGIDVRDSQGNLKNAGQLWVELADATRSWSAAGEDAGKRLGVLQNIIGSVDKETLALLNEGGGANQTRLEEARRIGTIYTKEMADNMRRIQSERRAEAAEEKAWAERKAMLWAQLGADLNALAHQVEWGQTTFVEAVTTAWDRVGTFVGDWIEMLKGYYQGFLTFTRDTLAQFGESMVPAWLENAVRNGPGPKGVVPALSGRTPDGTPLPNATPPGSIKPPSPLAPPPGGKSGGDSGLDLKKHIDSLSGAALSEQAALLGDKYGSRDLAAWKDYANEINELTKKLQAYEGANKEALERAGWYWATYRLGIKLAGNEIEHARDVLGSYGASQAKLGDLLGDPSHAVEGKLKQLSVNFAKEYDAIAGDARRSEEEKGREIATLHRRAAEERFQIENAALGDLARLDEGYIARKMQGIDATLDYLRKRGVDESAIRAVEARKLDELNKQALEARIGTEESFGAYLADRVALNSGLYRSAQGQIVETWRQTADAVTKGIGGVADAVNWTFGQIGGDALTGKLKEAGNYVQQFLAQLKQAFSSFFTDLLKIGTDKYLFRPALEALFGTGGSGSRSGAYGLVNGDTVSAVESAAGSAGLLGAFTGALGAQRITSSLPTSNAISLLLGEDVSARMGLRGFGVPAASFGAGTPSAVIAGAGGASGATVPGVSLDSFAASSGMRMVALDGVTYAVARDGSMTAVGQASGRATVQGRQSGSSGNFLGDLIKGSLGKESGWVQSLNQWGYDNFGLGSLVSGYSSSAVSSASTAFSSGMAGSDMTGYQALMAGDRAAVSSLNSSGLTTSVTGGLGTAASGALMGAGLGYGVSSLIYPNGTGTVGGTVGGALGGAAGAIAGTSSMLAGTALGSVAGPVGAVLGGVVGSLLTGSTTSETSLTGETGATVTVTAPLSSVLSGWASNRTTTSGLFGSSETTHNKQWTSLDPALAKAWNTAWTRDSSNVRSRAQDLGMDLSSWSTYSFPLSFDINSGVVAQASSNVATNMSQVVITANDLRDAFDDVARGGEDYYTELERISAAYAAGSIAADKAGTSLAALTGYLNVVYQGEWVSQASDIMGGLEDVTSAFSILQKYTMTTQEQWQASLEGYASKAAVAIAQLGEAGVTLENFWDRYEEAASGGLDPETFAKWANAADYMAQFSSTEQQAVQLVQAANQTRLSSLQAELTLINTQKVMVDGLLTSVSSAWSTFSGLADSLESTLQSLSWNTTLSGKSNRSVLSEMEAHYNRLLAKVQGEGPSSPTYSGDVSRLAGFASTYLSKYHDVYGSSATYYGVYESVTDTLESLEASTRSEADILLEQLEVQYDQVNAIQAEVDQLTLANANLTILAGSIQTAGQAIASALSALGVDSSYTDPIVAAVATADAAIAASASDGPPASSGAQEAAWTAEDALNLYNALNQSMYGTPSASPWLGEFAGGGSVTGPGSFLVGERGLPEIVTIGAGSTAHVRSNRDVRQAVGMDSDAMIGVSRAGFTAIVQELRELRAMNVRTASALERLASRVQ
ncbi:hypothetical protein NNJEOMEG_03305 [Fundidesulfovibrio magnetotacticus]|uniref:Uncharacterized protein n=1 Tax=Fundidesulfovibrio magnetotacticus TaxID=2730080 RepID=A0A6V8LSI7_9BACT|nr:phage tail tape measure protein [Fundidesulfovibrio magnetotacticus]GFK95442.1 hypothetical protein NNJEOMEG_03305 [Fundidesulfovibrio magnetotacticus]